MLEIDQLTFQRGQQKYIFHATASAGCLTLIRGASGIGKSTLLDCLAGFETPTGGVLRWAGQEFQHLAVHERPLSLLQQSDNLFPHLNVLENVCLATGGISKTGKAQALSVLEQLELHEIAHKSVTDISGGQAQRVGLARSILRHEHSPRPILLLDEPYSALDEETANRMHDGIRTLCHTHKLCVLFVAHRKVSCDQIWTIKMQDSTVVLESNPP